MPSALALQAYAHLHNPWKFRAYATVAQSIPNATYTTVTLGTEDFDPNNNFASNTYTVPVDGYYHLAGSVMFAVGSYSNMAVAIFVNGTNRSEAASVSTGATFPGQNVRDILKLNAGDTVVLQAFQSSSGAANTYVALGTGVSNYLSGIYLSAA